MRKYLVTAAGLAMLAALGISLPTYGQEEDRGLYLRYETGVTVDALAAGQDIGGGSQIGGGVGYDLGNFRVEGTADRLRHDYLGAELTADAYMLSGFYDFEGVSDSAVPFVGAGYGIVKASADVPGYAVAADGNVMKATGGVSIPAGEHMDLEVGLTHYASDGLTMFGNDVDFEGQVATVGLRFDF